MSARLPNAESQPLPQDACTLAASPTLSQIVSVLLSAKVDKLKWRGECRADKQPPVECMVLKKYYNARDNDGAKYIK